MRSMTSRSSPLVRFGVAMEEPLLRELDALADARGATRSELLRDLVRAEVSRSAVGRGVPAVAALTLVYDHHVRDLTEKLTEMQHDLGDQVRATLHVHLDHDRCLEVIVMHGRSDELRAHADKLVATRGVTHGGVEIVTSVGARTHAHAHPHAHGHPRAHRGRKSATHSAR
jgi:CopG family nickel-responsive transcriptional regulator